MVYFAPRTLISWSSRFLSAYLDNPEGENCLPAPVSGTCNELAALDCSLDGVGVYVLEETPPEWWESQALMQDHQWYQLPILCLTYEQIEHVCVLFRWLLFHHWSRCPRCVTSWPRQTQLCVWHQTCLTKRISADRLHTTSSGCPSLQKSASSSWQRWKKSNSCERTFKTD